MARMWGRMPRYERLARRDGTPVGIHIGFGVATVVSGVMVSALVPVSAGGWRLVPVAVALAMVGAGTVDLPAVAAVTVLAWLLVDGFLANRYGLLTWHGMADANAAVVLSISAGVGLAFGAVRNWLAQRRRFLPASGWVASEPISHRGLMVVNKEDVPGG